MGGQTTMRETIRASNYDFRQAHSLSADQLRELQEHCVNLCRALQRFVPESTGLAVRFALDRLVATTFDAYLDDLPDSPILAVCEVYTNGSPVVWQIDTGPALAYMDAMLGGDGLTAAPEERELTLLERSLVSQIVEEFMLTWADSWTALGGSPMRVTEVRQTTGRFGTASLQEAAVVAVLTCRIAEIEGLIRIALPSALLRALLKQAGSTAQTGDVHTQRHWAAASEIGGCPVVIAAQLARTQMTLRELALLKPGDVLTLDRGPRDELELAIAGVTKFHGISGLVNGRLAVRVTGQTQD